MNLVIGGFAQGKNQFAQNQFPSSEIWKDFHLFVKERLTEGKTTSQITEEVLSRITLQPEIVIVCNELGCGIVPMEKTDREWREITGRILCVLAEKAEQVYRVTCGIGVKIK